MCSGVKRTLSNTGHAIGTVNLPTISTHLEVVELNDRLLSGVLTPQSSELTEYSMSVHLHYKCMYMHIHSSIHVYVYIYICSEDMPIM